MLFFLFLVCRNGLHTYMHTQPHLQKSLTTTIFLTASSIVTVARTSTTIKKLIMNAEGESSTATERQSATVENPLPEVDEAGDGFHGSTKHEAREVHETIGEAGVKGFSEGTERRSISKGKMPTADDTGENEAVESVEFG